jgi:hypothetical protein
VGHVAKGLAGYITCIVGVGRNNDRAIDSDTAGVEGET